jgi:hypothetical protein
MFAEPRRRRRVSLIAWMALLLLAVSASPAIAANGHGTRAAHPTTTAGLTAHLPLSALDGHAALLPGRFGRVNAAAAASAIGAGQYATADQVPFALNGLERSGDCSGPPLLAGHHYW